MHCLVRHFNKYNMTFICISYIWYKWSLYKETYSKRNKCLLTQSKSQKHHLLMQVTWTFVIVKSMWYIMLAMTHSFCLFIQSRVGDDFFTGKLAVSVPDEGFCFRNASCALNEIYSLLLHCLKRWKFFGRLIFQSLLHSTIIIIPPFTMIR